MGAVVNVAVLFTDIVSSTALAERLGPERAEPVRRQMFDLFRSSIVGAGGREVKNLGDGVMAVFPTPSAAVAAAVELQRSVSERNLVPGVERVEVRVGLAVGEADEDDGDVFGRPVVEAARLCAIAAPGEVLATATVRDVVRGRGGHEFVDRGAMPFKGFEEPVAVVSVVGAAAPVASRRGRQVFAGRQHELAVLGAAWSRVVEGSAWSVTVAGEAGIGKSTLVHHFASGRAAAGAVVAAGRCDQDLPVPYHPWLGALGAIVQAAPPQVVAAHREARGDLLLARVPARLGQGPSVAWGNVDRYELYGAVVDLLSRVTADAPVVLVLEDLHWVDRGSTQLWLHVVEALADSPLLLLGTYRAGDVHVSHPLADLLPALHRIGSTSTIELAGLDGEDLEELLVQLAGEHELDVGPLRELLHEETGGNPFFVREVLHHLVESGRLRQRDDGTWIAPGGLDVGALPTSVRHVVAQRVSHLGATAESVLRAAAVLGREFDVPTLAALVDRPEDEVLEVMDAALEASLVDEVATDRFAFRHALVAHSLLGALTSTRRARLHRRAAELLEAQRGHDDEVAARLAHHWAAVDQPDARAKSVAYAAMAGRQAMTASPEEALRWLTTAVEHAASARAGRPSPSRAAHRRGGGAAALRATGVSRDAARRRRRR
jgi:class 3 adenylate cyclase